MSPATAKRLTKPKAITGYAVARAQTNKALIAAFGTGKRRNKYGAVKVKLDGHTFDSKAEARRYGELRMMEKAGKITALRVHPKWTLSSATMTTTYTADFGYHDFAKGHGVCEDVKSKPTAAKREFLLARILLWHIYKLHVTVVGCPDPADKPKRKRAA